ncbi:unnamed protein product [Acanthoscelides obtectus]|uniref:PiggyBac transposable element-derived protein domain-containing protein n=1 Tax=Acanthoscelides obtectus TaxID=200917 RepID=A0A9P0K405_ACAOB|nr:unnamed protein product [Acanthoscelides obtectus]CAK1667371.1 PiggyBac transposable element-derived protein 4 [Acanthoscelides obtectus]
MFCFIVRLRMESDSDESFDGVDIEGVVDESGSGTGLDVSTTSSDSSNSENVLLARNWCELGPDSSEQPTFPFSARPSVHFDSNDEDNLLQFFEQFFDAEIIDHIVTETNRYTNQKKFKKWFPVTAGEMRVFLGLIILQSIIKKPEMRQYWSKSPLLLTPFFAKCLSNKRFEAIRSNLHFADNETFDAKHHPNPKLNKIWPIYDKLVNKFRATVTPEKHVAIDESLLLYKGRLG